MNIQPIDRTRGAFSLTPPRLKVLAVILDADREGRRVSTREICAVVGRTHQAVQGALRGLLRIGLVTWEPGKARTLRPLCRWIPAREL